MKKTSNTTLLNWMHDRRVSLVYNAKFHMWEAVYNDGLTERSGTPRNALMRLRDTIHYRDS